MPEISDEMALRLRLPLPQLALLLVVSYASHLTLRIPSPPFAVGIAPYT